MPKILVVDDDPLIRDVLSDVLPLQWPSVMVMTACDGDEALSVVGDQELRHQSAAPCQEGPRVPGSDGDQAVLDGAPVHLRCYRRSCFTNACY